MYATMMKIWFIRPADSDIPGDLADRVVMAKMYKKNGGSGKGTTVHSESQLQSHPRHQSPNHEDPGELSQIALELEVINRAGRSQSIGYQDLTDRSFRQDKISQKKSCKVQ